MISAYLSVFDDWQLLGSAMASIEPLVDEIVVADGAYEWVAPHLPPGRDPKRSDPRVREALAPYASKTRFIEGIWRDEIHKRAAGYEACRGRYIMRVDADEVLFPTQDWEAFFTSGKAAAQALIMAYAGPSRQVGGRSQSVGSTLGGVNSRGVSASAMSGLSSIERR